jgi:hypothetical protein
MGSSRVSQIACLFDVEKHGSAYYCCTSNLKEHLQARNPADGAGTVPSQRSSLVVRKEDANTGNKSKSAK